jgi:uncharacterized phage-associated protein
MASAVTVADRFLALARERGKTLTPMQLLKLVYIAHGWSLGLYGMPLIRDEVQAWQYGPVIPRLYNAVKSYRSQPVEGLIHPAEDGGLDARESSVIRQVYEKYGDLSGPALSRLTHAPDTPWDLVYRPGAHGLVIPNDMIEDHYSRLSSAD